MLCLQGMLARGCFEDNLLNLRICFFSYFRLFPFVWQLTQQHSVPEGNQVAHVESAPQLFGVKCDLMANKVGVTSSPRHTRGSASFPGDCSQLALPHSVLLPNQNGSSNSHCLIYSNVSSETIRKDAYGPYLLPQPHWEP